MAIDLSSVDLEFVDKVPEDNLCSICTNILSEPVIVECCGQLFCEECLKKWIQRQKTCPHCRNTELKYIKNRRMKRIIDGLRIFCPNRSKGCDKISNKNECSAHLKTCLFVEVPCTNDCGLKMLRKEIENHIARKCPKRKVKCQYCKEESFYKEITTKGHLDKCLFFPLDCPNNCWHGKIQRKDLMDHQKECPLEPVKCPFFDAGCKHEMPRKELTAHKASNAASHLELVMIMAMNTQHQLEAMTRTAQTTQDQLDQVTQKSEATQETVEKAVNNEPKVEMHTAKARQDELKATQDELKVTQDELKQLAIKFDGLASCVTRHLFVNPQNLPAMNHIKTALQAMTTMLDQSKQYCLPLVTTTEDVIRSPSFYVRPGYKMCVSNGVYLLKGEYDDKIEWPMPKMNIELITVDNRRFRTITICVLCGDTINRVKNDQTAKEIRKLEYVDSPKAAPTPLDSILITVMRHYCFCISS